MSDFWTLAAELQKVTSTQSEAEALFSLGILHKANEPYDVRADSEWWRGGAETYAYRFWVKPGMREESGFILKACVSGDLSLSLNETVQKWVARRSLLRNHGISTPHLLYVGHAQLIEELIPHKLSDYIVSHREHNSKVLSQMVYYAATLARLGFVPVDPFGDLRTRDGDLVVVDFGEDLGPSQIGVSERSDIWEQFLKTAREWKLLRHGYFPSELYQLFVASSSSDVSTSA